MKRKVLGILLVLVIVGGIVLILFLMGAIGTQNARVYIESTPNALVYVNGEEAGLTPLEKDYKAGEVTIKLIPQSQTPLTPYEVKVNLTSGVKTIVRRNIGESIEKSSGEIISFERQSGEASIAVVSSPDGAQVKLDGQARGVAPIKISDASLGTHQITVSAVGYNDRNFSIQTTKGYRLTAIVTLSGNGGATQPDINSVNQTPSPSPSASPSPRQVEILDTPVGFLRVRSGPSSSSDEIAQVKPGEKYNYLEQDKTTGWYKIQVDGSKSGWVSDDYAKLEPEN